MAKKKTPTKPSGSVKDVTLYEDFFKNNVAHCLRCGAVGSVIKSKQSGDSSRRIHWTQELGKKLEPITYTETWDTHSAPSICVMCWDKLHPVTT